MTIIRYFVTLIFQCTPQSFKHFLRDRLSQETVDKIKELVLKKQVNNFQSQKNRARKLEDKLWCGFSSQALSDLCDLRDDPEAKVHVKVYAAWALARWYVCRCEYEKALEHAELIRKWRTWKSFDLAQALLEIDCLVNLEQYDEARRVVNSSLEYRPTNSQLHLALANTYMSGDNTERLHLINELYKTQGFCEIALQKESEPLAIGNIKPALPNTHIGVDVESPTVTIIMPVYHAEQTLHIAVDSLLEQSWQNIEILIVDDCSPDDTFAVAKQYEASDSRVKAFQQSTNQGAYQARNLGLLMARGEFVTTHDADDWSHPQKIETQVKHLLTHIDSIDANVTHWVRVFPNLLFRGTSRPTSHMIQWNHSSLMMRRELLLELGGWDKVRITGDTELIWRLEHFTGHKLAKIHKDVPLSFALEDPASLTRQGNSHVWSIHYGVRREYREMANYWHKNATENELKFKLESLNRPFPAPGFIQANKLNDERVDVLLIMNGSRVGDAHDVNMAYINYFLEQGKKIGLFHWPHYYTDVTKPLNDELRQIALGDKISIIVAGENVKAQEVFALNPLALRFGLDRPPLINAECVFIVADSESVSEMQEIEDFDPQSVDGNLKSLFGIDSKWITSSIDSAYFVNKGLDIYSSNSKLPLAISGF